MAVLTEPGSTYSIKYLFDAITVNGNDRFSLYDLRQVFEYDDFSYKIIAEILWV